MQYKFLLLTSSDKFGYITTLSIFGINIALLQDGVAANNLYRVRRADGDVRHLADVLQLHGHGGHAPEHLLGRQVHHGRTGGRGFC